MTPRMLMSARHNGTQGTKETGLKYRGNTFEGEGEGNV